MGKVRLIRSPSGGLLIGGGFGEVGAAVVDGFLMDGIGRIGRGGRGKEERRFR